MGQIVVALSEYPNFTTYIAYITYTISSAYVFQSKRENDELWKKRARDSATSV